MADAIEDKIEQNESKITYEHYLIWLRSYELKSGGWVPRALVVVPSEEGNGEQELIEPGASTVSTREDADTQTQNLNGCFSSPFADPIVRTSPTIRANRTVTGKPSLKLHEL